MHEFGPPSYDPYGDFRDDPFQEPLSDPFDPFADPYEAMFDALGLQVPGNLGALGPLAPTNSHNPLSGQDDTDMDNHNGMLDLVEDHIEHSPPIPPAPGEDTRDTIMTALEEHIENTSIPPEPKIEVEFFEDQGWGYPTPSIDTPSPPHGIHDNPPKRSTPDERPIGRRWGRVNDTYSAENKIWCPVENNYVSPEACEDKDCEHYNSDNKDCTYYNRQRIEGFED